MELKTRRRCTFQRTLLFNALTLSWKSWAGPAALGSSSSSSRSHTFHWFNSVSVKPIFFSMIASFLRWSSSPLSILSTWGPYSVPFGQRVEMLTSLLHPRHYTLLYVSKLFTPINGFTIINISIILFMNIEMHLLSLTIPHKIMWESRKVTS